MSAQVYGWPDGNVFIWTGGAGATSAVPAYATDSTVRFTFGVDNRQTLTGTYQDVVTGRRVDITIGGLYSNDWLALQKMAQAETAIHMHLVHNDGLGSGGAFMWSGFVDSVEYMGRENDLFRVRWSYHANVWSGY